jgi:hypothetical protein
MTREAASAETRNGDRLSVHALVIAGLGVLALAALRILPLDAPPLSLLACPFRAATGLPCLGCGCLHAFAHVVRLELGAAFLSNPLGALAALGCALFAIHVALRLCGVPARLPRIDLGAGGALRVRAGIAILIAANWAFVAARTAP